MYTDKPSYYSDKLNNEEKCRYTINALMRLSVKSKKPIGNGILTCINKRQAIVRSSISGKKRKGREAAKAALSVLGILKNESK